MTKNKYHNRENMEGIGEENADKDKTKPKYSEGLGEVGFVLGCLPKIFKQVAKGNVDTLKMTTHG